MEKHACAGVSIAALTLLVGCTAWMPWNGRPQVVGKQTPRTFEKAIEKRAQYLLYLPPDYSEGESWPLVLFLHGAGERGTDLDLVTKHGLPKLIKQGKDFPFIVVSPQCPEGTWWDTEMLLHLVDEMMATYSVDPDRVYVTGLSMGGFGAWELLLREPERFAAAAPICGGGIPYLARWFSHVPVWVFHGAKDPVVPLRASEDMVQALKACDGDVQFTVYPEAQHDSWTATYENPELYRWLLSHRRPDEQAEEEAGESARRGEAQ
jgi:predicted peptidase